MYQDRFCVPRIIRSSILRTFHDSQLFGDHFGINTTLLKIESRCFWPHLSASVKEYVSTCVNCQLMKQHRPHNRGLLHSSPIAEGHWNKITLDFLTGIPESFSKKNMILVVVDRFSKRAHFIPCQKTIGAPNVIDVLFRYVFCYHGFPNVLTSGRDIRFLNTTYKELAKRLGIELAMSSSNHPATDGQSERVIQVLRRLLRSYCHLKLHSWDRTLPMLEYCYNSTPKHSPFEVDLGFMPNQPKLNPSNELDAKNTSTVELTKKLNAIDVEFREMLQEAAVTNEEKRNPGRKEIILKPGDYVLVHRVAYFTKGEYWKTQPIYLGPSKVVKRIHDKCVRSRPTSSKENSPCFKH
ncbi:uncharacterized protein SKDI_15G2110 [Saccharomyces kudriavzevii IFO 1802]|uniref:Integrase catalytic domain-containing protein n=1 Tax=Saccharomyces kudriavzevii (strain ATCC MYA-4449 / AS 2.2408 / CBS 8840 / NBRC 1802 / NCYC 2889) TaxID=226230 RepID=A0AA35J9T1_SACK1|nr:uncharacterized protein SKDI_15G2110 [Saccharomyces kudriavzevii IFO 1802]CAI4051372.1 hypothetical protein SKDI_15G2110 [Saccharomyces kudriavzevii IFO 1802]